LFTSFGRGGWHFSLLGFPVRVDPSFWIVSVLLGITLDDPWAIAIWVGVCFVSILAHELGHALMGRAFGLHGSIELHSMGGLTQWPELHKLLSPARDIAVSLAGPFTGLVIAACTYSYLTLRGWPESPYGRVTVYTVLWINGGWALVNLLPILPLDGGHVMESAVHWRRGYRDDALPFLVSSIFASAAVAAALVLNEIWIAMFAGWLTVSNVMKLKMFGQLRRRDVEAGVIAALLAGFGLLALLRFTGRL
jgi:Zn-dependent protease